MIYTFRFISDEEESFMIDVNINHNQTFEQLHKFIQKTLKYDSSQLASFFTSNEQWEKIDEISFMDMGNDSDVRIMQETYIGDLFNDKNERILYVFDYLSERLFFGSVIRTIDAKSPIELPSVSKLNGDIPPQFKEIVDQEINDTGFDDFDDDEGFDFDELPDDLDNFDPNNY